MDTTNCGEGGISLFALSSLKLNDSKEGIERIKKINSDLKAFAREGQEGESMSLYQIEQVLDSSVNVITNEIKYKATLKKEYGNIPEIVCDGQKLGQVFMNLLINAGHAIEQNGTITIKTYEKDKDVWIEISDTGCGIPESNLEKIFDPFFTTKPVGIGTGLGLSISGEIVKKHNGAITVESEVGRGTTFRIRLPKSREG